MPLDLLLVDGHCFRNQGQQLKEELNARVHGGMLALHCKGVRRD